MRAMQLEAAAPPETEVTCRNSAACLRSDSAERGSCPPGFILRSYFGEEWSNRFDASVLFLSLFCVYPVKHL